MSIDKTLEERGATHGDFETNALISQSLCQVLRSSPNWEGMSAVECEALEMVMHKVARIVTGAPCLDHYRDCAGYLKLVENYLSTQPGTVDVQVTKVQLNHAKKWVKV